MTDLLAVARGDRVHVEDDDVVRAASSEGLLGLLARAATNPVRELQIQAITIEAYSAFMAGELARIAGVFTERNVPLIAFKGPVLSQQLIVARYLRGESVPSPFLWTSLGSTLIIGLALAGTAVALYEREKILGNQ